MAGSHETADHAIESATRYEASIAARVLSATRHCVRRFSTMSAPCSFVFAATTDTFPPGFGKR